MPRLSEEARTLIARLYRQPGLWQSLRPGDDLPDALRRLGELAEPAALPDLLSFALHRREEIAAQARAAIHRTLAVVPISRLSWLDGHLRQRGGSSLYHGTGWTALQPAAVADFGGSESWLSLTALATFHGSGFVRQAALGKLAATGDGRELPYLLLRVNDWVAAIRRLARALIADRLVDGNASHFAACLPILRHLERGQRADHGPLLDRVRALLLRPRNLGLLHQAIAAADRAVSRQAFRIVLDAPGGAGERTLRLAVRSPDPMVRLWTVKALPASLPAASALDLLATVGADPLMAVRREALVARVERLGRRDRLDEHLLDPHPSVRYLVRHYLGDSLPEPAAFYRAALESARGRAAAAALGGLAETGGRSDAERARPFLDHPLVGVRRSAVRALARLDLEAGLDVLPGLLESPSPKVSREAANVLAGVAGRLDDRSLWAMFDRSAELHVKRGVLALLARLSKWRRLPYLLRAARAGPPEIARTAVDRLRDWAFRFNRDFTQPGEDSRRACRRELERAGDRLPADLRRSMEFLLRGS